MKPIFILFVLVVSVTIILPTLLAFPNSKASSGKLQEGQGTTKQPSIDIAKLEDSSIEVALYRSVSKIVEPIPLEKYIVGVVASEMPADFEIEALKAQALAARTYIVNQMLRGEQKGLPEGAHASDTIDYQVYKSDEQLKELWGKDYDWKMSKISRAVIETAGEILTYDGEPITATFFSTSNGFTENSEDYWENPYPYLKSVESPWDKDSPKFYNRQQISVSQFEKKLGVTIKNASSIGTIVEKTPGKRIGSVNFNGKILTGKQIREKLDLKSADFMWERNGDSIIITTKGYGHGVGMSQYGANGMAKSGKTYEEIVKYYYQGIEIASTEVLEEKIVARR